MFSKFQETSTDAVTHDAVYRIEISLPENQNPQIQMDLDKRVMVNGESFRMSGGSLSEEFNVDPENGNLAEFFRLRNPETAEETGSTMTYAELVAVVYSFVYHVYTKGQGGE